MLNNTEGLQFLHRPWQRISKRYHYPLSMMSGLSQPHNHFYIKKPPLVAFLWSFYLVRNIIIQAYTNFANSAVFILIYFDCCTFIGYARLHRNNLPNVKQKIPFGIFFWQRMLCNCAKKKYLSSSQRVESLKKKVLRSLYAYCTSSILGLHDIVFVLFMSTLIAIMFSINKK